MVNPPLVRKFLAKQQQLHTKNNQPSEVLLGFHGTKESNIPSIIQNNFDLSFLAKNTGNTGAFGAGIYFSEYPGNLCNLFNLI